MNKICTKCDELKPVDAFHVDRKKKDGRTGACKVCRIKFSREWNDANVERYAAIRARYSKAHRPRLSVYQAAWAKAHPEVGNARQRRWSKANAPKRCAIERRYRKTHRATISAKKRRHHAAKLNAAPAWANKFYIDEIYDLAMRRTKSTGMRWEVDHIVPLNSKLVCGLHVEHNLQVIPASINASKGNRHWPDMPDLRM